MSKISIIVVTPEETALEESTSFVALPLHDGEKGIGPDHAPMIGKLGYGELRFERDGQTVRYYVDGGFVQIADNVVSVITERAIPSGKLNKGEVKEQLQAAAIQRANSDELLDARDKAVGQARAQLRVATRN